MELYKYLLGHEFCYAMTVILVIEPDAVYWHLKNKGGKRGKHRVFKSEHMNNVTQDLPPDPHIIEIPLKEKKKE